MIDDVLERLKENGVDDPEAILRTMESIFDIDKTDPWAEPDDPVSDMDLAIRCYAEYIMPEYDNLPSAIRVRHPREKVDASYAHLQQKTQARYDERILKPAALMALNAFKQGMDAGEN
ncbi:hypothetical protein ACFL96_12695 [Thermoproteota archaeon]